MAEELHDLLDIPREVFRSSGGFQYVEPTKGRQIIATIARSMVDALRREEMIRIKGFGTFTVKVRPVCSGGTLLTTDKYGEITGLSPVHVPYPPKKRVIFRPSQHLLDMVNRSLPIEDSHENMESV